MERMEYAKKIWKAYYREGMLVAPLVENMQERMAKKGFAPLSEAEIEKIKSGAWPD